LSYEIVTLPAYRAVGLKWAGTYADIVPNVTNVIQRVEERANELKHKVNPTIRLGLSYHVIDNGFVYYSVYEVSEVQEVPNGMIEMRIPEWTYVKTTHHKGEEIEKTYTDLHEWLFNSDYTALKEADVIYYDSYMPIKHEHYPVDGDPNEPHFDIYIPIVKKCN